MLDTNTYEPEVIEKAAEAIEKIQNLGYTFVFDIPSRKYQACVRYPDASMVPVHNFDNLHEIIKWAEDYNL